MESKTSSDTAPLEGKIHELEHQLAEKNALIEELLGKLDQMQKARKSHKIIDRAKCLLTETGATEKEAASRMRKLSMDTRKPLVEIAEAIILGYKASR